MHANDAETPKLLDVAQGVWVRQEIDNIGWVDLGEKILVVDAMEKPETRDGIFEYIRDTGGGKPVGWVLNTHTHYDHVALNDDFHREWGAEIVNAATHKVPAEGLTFEGSGRRAIFLPMPDCHTREDCVVWIPDVRVLFVGDIFGWGLIPLTRNLRSAEAALLTDTYRRLIDFGAETVVPGHGPLCDNATLERWVAYFHQLQREAISAVAAGESDEQIAHRLAPPEDMTGWWRFTRWKHDDTVAKVIKSARKGWIEPPA